MTEKMLKFVNTKGQTPEKFNPSQRVKNFSEIYKNYIAPKAEDVTNPEAMLNKVSFHPEEHALLAKLTDLGLSDLFRKFDTRPGQFSWWDFRTMGFERAEGMRIDYILGNSVLTSSCQACIIDIEAREQDRPSDHAPVIAEFKL